MKDELLSKVIIRVAEPRDTQQVFAFLEDVWEGGDYVPSVWDKWLADPNGRLVVAALDGQPIGIGRIVDLGWGEYWLEGLRVAKPFRGKGVAGLIQGQLLSVWVSSDSRSIGYLTHRDQEAVHSLARHENFDEIFRVQMVRWGPEEGRHNFIPCEDLAWAADRLGGWASEHALDGRMELEWAYPQIRPERLEGSKHLYKWKERAVVLLNTDDWEDARTAVLSAVCVDEGDLTDFFVDLGRLCSMLELDGGRWFAPAGLMSLVEENGSNIRLEDDLEMVCYLKQR